MNTYILLITIIGYQSGGMASAEFIGKQACELAASEIADRAGGRRDVIYTCTPKHSNHVSDYIKGKDSK